MKFPSLKNKYKDDLDFADKLLKVYSTLQDKPLTNFERKVMVYYIIHDVSKETRDYIKEDTNKKANYLNQIDFLLKEKGYLVDEKNNYRKKKLSVDMKAIRDSFFINRKRVYILTFD